jgi:hypothetical protein
VAYLDKNYTEMGPGPAVGFALEGMYSAVVARSAVYDPDALHQKLSQRGPKVDILLGHLGVEDIHETTRRYTGQFVMHDGMRARGSPLPHRFAPETSVVVELPVTGDVECLAQTLPRSTESERDPNFDTSRPVDNFVIRPGDVAFWPNTSVFRIVPPREAEPAYDFERLTGAHAWYGPILAAADGIRRESWIFPIRRRDPMLHPTTPGT